MRNSSMLFKIFLAVTLFLILPLFLVGAIFNYNFINYSENEIGKSVIEKLELTCSNNSLFADYLAKDAIKLSIDNTLNSLYGVENYLFTMNDWNNINKVTQSQNIISDMVKTNNRLQSVYLYLENADYVLTSDSGVVPKTEFNDPQIVSIYEEFVKDKTQLPWLEPRRIQSNGVSDINNTKHQSENFIITYICPLTAYTTKLRGAIIINIFEDSLCKLNNMNANSKGSISIINTQGDVISHVDKTLVSINISDREYISNIINSKDGEGYFVTTASNKRKLVSYYKSDFNNWIYVGEYSLDTLMDRVDTLRRNIVYIVSGIVLLGVILSYFISRKIYNPVKRLVQDIKKHKGFNFMANENEMSVLSRAFTTLSNQEEQLFNILERNKRNIRDNILKDLLNGNIMVNDDNGDFGVDFPFDNYICATVVIDRFNEFVRKYAVDQQYYLQAFILKAFEEVLNTDFKSAGLALEQGKFELIINLEEFDEENTINRLKEHFLNAQKEISKVIDNPITIGIGKCFQYKEGVRTSFLEAQEAVKNKLILGLGHIFVYNSAKNEGNKYWYPYTIEKHILNSISLGLKEETFKAVNQFIDEVKGKSDISYDNTLQIFNQLLGTIIKHLVDENINISSIFGENFNIYQDFAGKETVDEIGEWFIKQFGLIIEYFNINQDDDNKYYIDKIMDFIHKNYRRDIDINALADHVGLSYSYVRKLFKDETGKNVMDYINVLRITEAKRLITQTNMNIFDIALELGYNNDQSFNRFFKKYEGITPGDFRKLNFR